MNHIGIVIARAKKFEAVLKQHFLANGDGLVEQAKSVSRKLRPSLVRDLKYFGCLRNQFAHSPEVNRLKEPLEFIRMVNRIERAFEAAIPGYKAETVSSDELGPAKPVITEKIVYTSGPTIRQIVEIYSIPEPLIFGCGLVVLGAIVAFFQGGFFQATTYTDVETIQRWWWFDGTREVTKAKTEWNLAAIPFALGLLMILFSVGKFVFRNQPDAGQARSSTQPTASSDVIVPKESA